jgi:phytoene dehydrogenase-like protein
MADQAGQIDAIIIGAGHNGLFAAGYLACASKNVMVLEQRDRIGGACTLEEPFPWVYHVTLCLSCQSAAA